MTIITKNNTAATAVSDTATENFEFRNKFAKLLNEENREEVTAAFEYFCKYSRKDAKNCLWELSYSDESAEAVLEEELALSEFIALENVPALRNELRYQYQERDAEFLSVSLQEDCQKAFDELKNYAGILVAYVVHCHIAKRVQITEGLERILYLLKGEKEENYFGGIRSLSFSVAEATYLKQFHIQIAKLFDVMQSQAISENRSLANLDKMIAAAGMQLYPDESNEENDAVAPVAEVIAEADAELAESVEATDDKTEEMPIEIVKQQVIDFEEEKNTEKTLLNHENILENKELFESFIQNCNQLIKLGFDLDEVINKSNKIKTFLDAAKELF